MNDRAGRPYLVTNRHNVTGRHQLTDQPLSESGGIPNEIAIIHNHVSSIGSWVRKVEKLLDVNSNATWREHPRLGPKADLVALPLTDLEGVKLFPYPLDDQGPEISVGPAETVSVVGFPYGKTGGGGFAIWATGFVASEMAIDIDDLPVFYIDCRSRPGQSGSPVIAYRSGGMVVDENGNTLVFDGPVQRFLGIYSGRIHPESDIGIVWKATAIAELIGSL